MVGLLIALGQGAVGNELGFGEGNDDDFFDGFVGWAVVHGFVGGMLLFPGELSDGVGCEVGAILSVCGIGVRSWEVRAVGYRDKHGVVGGVSDGVFCECLHEGVEADEVGVPTAVVALECVNEAHNLDGVLLGCRSPLVLEAAEDGEELYLGVACDWGELFESAIEVGDDSL